MLICILVFNFFCNMGQLKRHKILERKINTEPLFPVLWSFPLNINWLLASVAKPCFCLTSKKNGSVAAGVQRWNAVKMLQWQDVQMRVYKTDILIKYEDWHIYLWKFSSVFVLFVFCKSLWASMGSLKMLYLRSKWFFKVKSRSICFPEQV